MEKSYVELVGEGRAPIKAWVRGVPFDDGARRQLENIARLPFVYKWVAAMPDVHCGIGATVGSVVATKGAIIPAAVGVDIGCGMIAVRTTLTRVGSAGRPAPRCATAIERAVPHGFTDGPRRARPRARGTTCRSAIGRRLGAARAGLRAPRRPASRSSAATAIPAQQLGTLGSGNHFIEVCLDEDDHVWFMLHSGSRGVGNRIGSYFIERAREDMRAPRTSTCPTATSRTCARARRASTSTSRRWTGRRTYAAINRRADDGVVVCGGAGDAGRAAVPSRRDEAVNCHHNYVAREMHFGEDVLVTRKGAVRAGEGDLGIIPGSMGARSFIVRGKGNPESFMSCSHGAGRAMSRTEAKRRFTVADHEAATAGVECRKDAGVIDETPAAYKSIDAVMEAQKDLVEVVHRLRQVVCVKG